MIPVLSTAQIRAFDRHASESACVPSLLLMENAGRGAAEVIERELGPFEAKRPARVVVVAGPGNNGGDGFVVARRLFSRAMRVVVYLAAPAEKLRGDALTNYQAWRGIGGEVRVLVANDLTGFAEEAAQADLLVDALLGTGLDREVSGDYRFILEFMNAAPCRKVALDVPSGLDAERGRVMGVAFKADFTVTFAHLKLGLCTPRGAQHSGRVEVCDIGVPADPRAVGHSAELVEARDVAAAVTPRSAEFHKSSAGRVTVVAGSPGKVGAALLSAHGALRTGAGLVTIATSAAAANQLDQRVLEAMTVRLEGADPAAALLEHLAKADAAVVGPGLGLDDAARALSHALIFDWAGPKVVDADAITHFAGHAAELKQARGRVVLTPHSAELGRLLGISAAEVEDDRLGAVARAVELTGAVVLLKGRYTVVGAAGEVPRLNPTGGPVMATGGAGDVLSGVLAALLCALSPDRAAYSAAFIHGAAAERWAQARSADRGILAHEIADELPAALAVALAARSRLLPD